MKKYLFIYIAALVFAFAAAPACMAQFASYDRSSGLIEFDLGTAKIKSDNVQKIFILRAGADIAVYEKGSINLPKGTGLVSTMSLRAPALMPADLAVSPVQMEMLVQPDLAKPDLQFVTVPVNEVLRKTTTKEMIDKLKRSTGEAEGKDDAELYLSGDVTTAVGSSPNWVVDAKYQPELTFRGVPVVIAPFFNLAFNSKVKGDTDKLSFGIKFIKPFKFAARDKSIAMDENVYKVLDNPDFAGSAFARQSKRARSQREYFQYTGSLEFESDWDFKVDNLITSQMVQYLLKPKFFSKDSGEVTGKLIFTPFIGAELGRNLKNPLTTEDRGISRLKAGATLTFNKDKPFGEHFAKKITWETTFTQRWFLLNERAFDKDDDGKLILKAFGRKPRSHFKSSIEFKINDYFGPVLTYEWGEEPPLYEKVNHKMKFGLVYSFSRKPIP